MNGNAYRDSIAAALRTAPTTVIGSVPVAEGTIVLSGETLSGKSALGPWTGLKRPGADTKAR